jgi:hypothetical protein
VCGIKKRHPHPHPLNLPLIHFSVVCLLEPVGSKIFGPGPRPDKIKNSDPDPVGSGDQTGSSGYSLF